MKTSHIALFSTLVLLATVTANAGIWPIKPAFPPNIPSSDDGAVYYTYATGGTTILLINGGCYFTAQGIQVRTKTWEYGYINGVVVRDRGNIGWIVDEIVYNCTDSAHPYFQYCNQSKNKDGITEPPTYTPGTDSSSDGCYDPDGMPYTDGWFYNLFASDPIGCQLTNEVFEGTVNGLHWRVDYTHSLPPHCWRFSENVCLWNQVGPTRCFPMGAGPSPYYRIDVQLDQGASLPPLASLGIPEFAGSFAAISDRGCTNCPSDTNAWFAHSFVTNAANGHLYCLLREMNWPAAEAKAAELGGHLATINDSNENDWVLNTYGSFGGTNRALWIGLHDAVVESTFGWISGDSAVYRKWMPGEPNNGGGYVPNEDQVVMRDPGSSYPGYWVDAPGGDMVYAAVVEIDPYTGHQPSILAGPVANQSNGHSYYLLEKTYWQVAEAQAAMLGGHLVTINDSAENDWVLDTFGSVGGVNRPFWIGLNDAATENAFVWVSGDSAAYRKWMPGEPNNGGGYFPNEDRVVMQKPGVAYAGYWLDCPDDQIYEAVVEVP